MAEEWRELIGKRFTGAQLELVMGFLRLSTEIGRRQMERLRATSRQA
jgi:hypothetical protein